MKKNFNRLIIASAIVYSSIGIFTPAWYLFLSERGGGSLQFGIALGLMSIAGGITAFIIGRVSDMQNKSLILGVAYIATAINVVLYTVASSIIFIYFLQFLYGVLTCVIILIENVIASMLTTHEKRASGMGFLSGVQQLVIGTAMIFGGGLASIFGVQVVFLLVSFLLICGGLLAFRINEKSQN